MRTWAYLSKIIFSIKTDHLGDYMSLIAGTVSEKIAAEFISYTSVYVDLPTIKEILKNPQIIVKNMDEPAVMWTLTFMVAEFIENDDKVFKPLHEFILRLPVEFQIICYKQIVKKDHSYLKRQEIKDLIHSQAVNMETA